jgi:hypothetical protein
MERSRPAPVVTDNRWPDSYTKFNDDVVDPDYDMPPAGDPVPDALDFGDYKIIDGLGKGGFSCVMLVKRQGDKKLFGLKVRREKREKREKRGKRVRKEGKREIRASSYKQSVLY